MDRLEVWLHPKHNPGGEWVAVDEFFFRSWDGKRRKDGKRYVGPLYVLGSIHERPHVWHQE